MNDVVMNMHSHARPSWDHQVVPLGDGYNGGMCIGQPAPQQPSQPSPHRPGQPAGGPVVRALSEAAPGLGPVSTTLQTCDAAPAHGPGKEQGAAAAAADTPAQTGNKAAAAEGGNEHKLPIRLQAISLRSSSGEPSSHGKHGGRLRGSELAAALDWEHGSLSNKNCEGSATSDEDHPRLVPRRGAGPDLRKEGRQIDEYLMRLLNGGSGVGAGPDAAGGPSKAAEQVAFPAGWNNSRPWFVAAQQQQQQALPAPEGSPPRGSGSPGGANGNPAGGAGAVRPVMPPPPFPQQPWQGSRLGPLPPLAIYPGWGSARPSEGRALKAPVAPGGNSSGVGCISEGTEEPASEGQEPAAKRARLSHPTSATSAQAPQKAPKEPDQAMMEADQAQGEGPIAKGVRQRAGEAGFQAVRATMLAQRATLQAQLADLHRLVRQQDLLTAQSAALAAVQQQAQQQLAGGKLESGGGDPRTVLVSSLGGSGSFPSSLPSAGPSSVGCQQPETHPGANPSVETARVAAIAARSQALRAGGAKSLPAYQRTESDLARQLANVRSKSLGGSNTSPGVNTSPLMQAAAPAVHAAAAACEAHDATAGAANGQATNAAGQHLQRLRAQLQQQQANDEAQRAQQAQHAQQALAQQQYLHAAAAQQQLAQNQSHYLTTVAQQTEAAWYSELMRHMGAAAAQQQQQPQMDPAAAWYYHYTQSTVADSVLKAAALYQTQQGVSPFWGRPLGGGGPAVSLHGGPTQTLAGYQNGSPGGSWWEQAQQAQMGMPMGSMMPGQCQGLPAMQAAGALGYLPQQQPQAQMMAGGSNNAGSGQAASEESARDSAGAGGGQSTGASAEGVPVATTGGSHAQAQQLKQAPHLVPGAGKAAPKDSAEDEATSSMSLPGKKRKA